MLVGDSVDGMAGIPGWGAKSSTTLLASCKHIGNIPEDPEKWDVNVRGANRLAENLNENLDKAIFYRQLITLRKDVPLTEKLEDLEWQGADESLKDLCRELEDDSIPGRVTHWRTFAA